MLVFDIVLEAQNYEQMFNDLLKLDPENPQLQELINTNVQWAKQNLKKNDRIVWFLRWVKVLLHRNVRSAQPNFSPEQGLAAYNQRYRTNYTWEDTQSLQALKTSLLHYTGMPIPAIQQHVFGNEAPNQLFAQFEQAEDAWRASMADEKSLLEPEEGDEVLLSFADGFAWWLLDRGACRAEAEAMGHCGNVPSERSGDRILSLRRKVVRGDIERWYPVATFILDRNDILGEMKGRANKKPEPKYHPYIIELLKHKMIEGIKGGGYMPEENFSMHDLDDDTREQLIADKPELGSFYDFYQKEGMTNRVLNMLSDKMNSMGLPEWYSYEADRKVFILRTYSALDDFCRTNSDNVVSGLLDLRERAGEVEPEVVLNAEVIHDFLDYLPDRVFSEVAKQMGIDPTDPNSEKIMTQQLESGRGPIYDMIEHSFHMAANTSDIVTTLDERIKEYIDVGWYFECAHVWLVLEDENDVYNCGIQITIDENSLVSMADADMDGDGDDEYSYDAQKVASSHEWDNIEWDNLNEKRREEGLTKRSDKRNHYDDVDTEFPDPEHVEFEASDLLGQAVQIFSGQGGTSPTINDPRQLSLPLPPRAVGGFTEQAIAIELAELSRRAGITIW